MGHVKQKKSRSSSASTPPETSSGVDKELIQAPPQREHSRSTYPEELNAEELISQINITCRHNINDSNNNSNSNSNTINRNSNQNCRNGSVDVEKCAPIRRHHRQRPLLRRVFNYIRNLWIGAKFNVGKDGKRNIAPLTLIEICIFYRS